MLGLASPLVAVVAIVVGWLRERSRQDHELKLQRTELEGQRIAKLREERLKAYSSFARLTKTVDYKNESPAAPLVEAHSEIEILADNPELRKAADSLLETWVSAWESASSAHKAGSPNPFQTPGFKNRKGLLHAHREAFIEFAKEELGRKPK